MPYQKVDYAYVQKNIPEYADLIKTRISKSKNPNRKPEDLKYQLYWGEACQALSPKDVFNNPQPKLKEPQTFEEYFKQRLASLSVVSIRGISFGSKRVEAEQVIDALETHFQDRWQHELKRRKEQQRFDALSPQEKQKTMREALEKANCAPDFIAFHFPLPQDSDS